ncbi:MAG: hypothetical protein DWQ02_14700 [Bacteroidetes bacterium]|nr:MAG: hypothetical protein DWQ02_14700 [Bacteroidota bacterium]
MESYELNEPGFFPFLIRDGWQVAKLNYIAEQHINNIQKIEVHQQTDEVFVLLKGSAVLIIADLQNEKPLFKIKSMQPLSVYNIPKGTWHNIAMEEGSEVLIVEKSNTHLHDVDYFELAPKDITNLKGEFFKS